MKPLRLNRLSKTVGLCLIGSSLILNGCQHRYPSTEEQQQAVASGGSHVHPSWWYFYHSGVSGGSGGAVGGGSSGSFVSSGRTVSGFKSSASVASVRGGFGASAHAISAGS